MEKTQADVIAQALLKPDVRAQDDIRRKRAAKAVQLARKRRVAWFALTGSCIGAAVAYFSGTHFSLGVIWGGLAGSVIGWLVTRLAA